MLLDIHVDCLFHSTSYSVCSWKAMCWADWLEVSICLEFHHSFTHRTHTKPNCFLSVWLHSNISQVKCMVTLAGSLIYEVVSSWTTWYFQQNACIVKTNCMFYSFCLYVDRTEIVRAKALKTRSPSQWWSGHSTTPHDVLNLWSPIYDPSVWGMWGVGMS